MAKRAGKYKARRHATLKERAKTLSRVEFLAALVHIAINKYVLPKLEPDVSNALERLLGVDVRACVHKSALDAPNEFRKTYLYSKAVNSVLRWHELSLRNIFDAISSVGSESPTSLIDLEAFLRAIASLEIIAVDATERDCSLCFVWSRMSVVDGRTHKGKHKESFLPFEGFLEAICRVAVLKAFPTDAEIRNAGCAHAGAYLDQLEEEDSEAYEELIESRNTDFGDEPDYQPIHRCVAHLIEMMIYRIEKLCGGQGDDANTLTISELDARKWLKSAGMEVRL